MNATVNSRIANVGDVIIAQLGNSFDSYWTPVAELFVISYYEGFGQRYYDCVGVRDDGTMFVKFGVYYRKDTDTFHSTCSLGMNQLDGRGAQEAHKVRELVRQYIDKILLIKPYTEIHKGEVMKTVSDTTVARMMEVNAKLDANMASIDTTNVTRRTPEEDAAKIAELTAANNKDRLIEVGKVYEAQLGNHGDTSGYCETAPILILRKEDVQCGDQWTALAKKPDGTPLFLYNVTKYRVIGYKLYCTRALRLDQLERFAPADMDALNELFEQYKAQFEALPAYAYTNEQ